MRMAKVKKILKQLKNAGEDEKKLNHSYVVDKNVKWYNHSEKQLGSYS